MKQLNSLGRNALKPKNSTIRFLLNYSKSIRVINTRTIDGVLFSKN
ncbi:hypothetical protein [Elizabethkingia argenteiflava]|nr:hypothetical protein [Elizabethkingia argenteiflava]